MSDDPYYEILGPRAGAFREALQQEVFDRGGVMDPDGRSAAMPDGAGYNFDNLARAIPPTASDEEIARGVRTFLGGLEDVPDIREHSWDEIKMRLRTRLSAFVPVDGDSLTRPMAEDLMQTLNVDFPESVVTLTDPRILERFGVDLPRAMHIALLNTAAELAHADIDVNHVEGHVWALSSRSFFTSGLVLLLDEALPALMDRDFDLDEGLLIAIPNRHVVLVGLLDAPGTMIDGVKTMIAVAAKILKSQPGGISPSVYYSGRDGFRRVAYPSHDEQDHPSIMVLPSERLQARMESGEI